MPRALSSTVLPAQQVADAAAAALRNLLREREELKKLTQGDYRKRHPFAAVFSREYPPEVKFIWEEFRRHDEACLEALVGLCTAALAANPGFTVEMTADDFRLLLPFYKAKKA